jgi:hypothetical protein
MTSSNDLEFGNRFIMNTNGVSQSYPVAPSGSRAARIIFEHRFWPAIEDRDIINRAEVGSRLSGLAKPKNSKPRKIGSPRPKYDLGKIALLLESVGDLIGQLKDFYNSLKGSNGGTTPPPTQVVPSPNPATDPATSPDLKNNGGSIG